MHLKNYVLCMQKFWSYQHQKISHKCYTLKQSEHTLKIDDQNLRLIKVNSDSEQEHIKPSHQYSEASSAVRRKDSEALLNIQDSINSNGFLQTGSSPKGKCVNDIKHDLWSTSLHCLYKQVSFQNEKERIHTQRFARSSLTHIQAASKFILYSKL